MPDISPSPQQLAFLEAVRSGTSIALIARAGTGKTTTLCLAAAELPQGLVLAFNKRIADEIRGRLPSQWSAQTMNSLGHHAWGRMLGRRLTIEADKQRRLVKAARLPWADLGSWVRLLDGLRLQGLVPRGAQGALPHAVEFVTSADVADLCDAFDLDFEQPPEMVTVEDLLRASINEAWQGVCDFTDQLYMPTTFRAPFGHSPIVMVDEAQDLSPLQHDMLGRLRPKQLIAVGDPRQAIYAWRGADSNSMATLTERFALTTLPLSVSFRCPRAIVREAQGIEPGIEAAPGAPQGAIHQWDSWTPADLSSVDALVCRTNAPLFALAFKLLSARIPFHIQGRDFGAGLQRLVKKLGPRDLPREPFLARLSEWATAEIAKAGSNLTRIERIGDRKEALNALALECNTLGEVSDALGQIFTRTGGLTLSTIHRAKGLEWQRVVILDSWRMPGRRLARAFAEDPQRYAPAMEQEQNLRYVAITRAQSELIYANLGDIS